MFGKISHTFKDVVKMYVSDFFLWKILYIFISIFYFFKFIYMCCYFCIANGLINEVEERKIQSNLAKISMLGGKSTWVSIILSILEIF